MLFDLCLGCSQHSDTLRCAAAYPLVQASKSSSMGMFKVTVDMTAQGPSALPPHFFSADSSFPLAWCWCLLERVSVLQSAHAGWAT